MARTRSWLFIVALALAACGGDDDESATSPSIDDGARSSDGDGSAGEASSPTSVDGSGVDVGGAGAEPAEAEQAEGEEAAADDSPDLGPQLEPNATIAIPVDDTGGGVNGIALSPTGDRIAALWRVVDADFNEERTLAVFDAGTGDELVSSSDDRLGNEPFWSSDDRLVSGANWGELWEWDSATLASVSDEPVSQSALESLTCGPSNGLAFDPAAGAVFMVDRGVCRVDLANGASVETSPDDPRLGNIKVALGGAEIYVQWVTDDNVLMRRTLDANTLESRNDEEAGPIVDAASGNGRIERLSGNDKVVQPAGTEIGFFGTVVETSAAGGYYFGERDGALPIVSSLDGSTVGWIDVSDAFVQNTAWSADDAVFATRTDGMLSVYRIG